MLFIKFFRWCINIFCWLSVLLGYVLLGLNLHTVGFSTTRNLSLILGFPFLLVIVFVAFIAQNTISDWENEEYKGMIKDVFVSTFMMEGNYCHGLMGILMAVISVFYHTNQNHLVLLGLCLLITVLAGLSGIIWYKTNQQVLDRCGY